MRPQPDPDLLMLSPRGFNDTPRASDKSLYCSGPHFPPMSNEGWWEDQTREGAVQTVSATAHFTDSDDIPIFRSLKVRVRLFATPWTIQSMEFSRPACPGLSFVLGRPARLWESEPGQGWVGAIVPAPTLSPGPARRGSPLAGGGLKAARRAPHVRRQHRLRPQRAAQAARLACRRGCPCRRAAQPALPAPGRQARPPPSPDPSHRSMRAPLASGCPRATPAGTASPPVPAAVREGRGCAARRARGRLTGSCSSAGRRWGRPRRGARRGRRARPRPPGASGRWALSAASPRRPPQPARLPPSSMRAIAVRVCVYV